jgi:colicin import membrane protein
MIRVSEKSLSYKAGILSFAVHGVLFIGLLLSVNWQTEHVTNIAEVELWDSLPKVSTVNPNPIIMPPTPTPESTPAPEPEKVPDPVPESQPEIVLEKKPEKPIEKPKDKPIEKVVEKPKDKPIEPLKDKPQAPQDLLKQLEALEQQEALKQLQAEFAGESNMPKKSNASLGEVDQHKAAIQRKIQANVNKSLCGSGKPTLTFEIALTPTGELQTAPKLIKASGINACDEAVERAILQSQPLPLPADAQLRGQFKNLTLKFTPNQ